MYSFEEYCKQFKMQFEDIFKKVHPEITEYEIGFEEVPKNNIILHGVFVKRKECDISPVFYIENSYDDYTNSGNFENSVRIAAERITENIAIPIIDMKKELLHYERVKDFIFPKLVNKSGSTSYLEKYVHLDAFYDIAEVFYIDFNLLAHLSNENGFMTVTISNEILSLYKKTTEELAEQALINLKREAKYTVTSMGDFLKQHGIMSDFIDNADNYMFIIHGDFPCNANLMLLQDVLDKVVEKTKGSFYILPSSTEEFLAIPYHAEFDINNLQEIVKEVNRTSVLDREKLSDSVYYYDVEKKKIFVVE